jgi:hypothetical protein
MRKTVDYFVKQIQSVDLLPEDVQQTVRQVQSDEDIHGILLIPPQNQIFTRLSGWFNRKLFFGSHKTPQRTLVFCADHITIIEADPSDNLNTIVIPLDGLIRITLGTVLLYAYLEFVWVKNGALETIQIEFNAAREDLVNEQLNQVRAVIAAYMQDSGQTRRVGEADMDIEALPFKFRNYLKDSLLPAENVLAVVFQPVMRHSEGFHRLIAPNRTVALTDQHVIFVEEEPDRATSHYSVITHYYPLRSIRQVKFKSTPDVIWMHMTVGTPETMQDVDVPLQSDEAARLNHTFSSISDVPVVLATA